MRVYKCPECHYQYDEATGNAHEGYKPDTKWLSLPQDLVCPGCAISLRDEFLVVESLGIKTRISRIKTIIGTNHV